MHFSQKVFHLNWTVRDNLILTSCLHTCSLKWLNGQQLQLTYILRAACSSKFSSNTFTLVNRFTLFSFSSRVCLLLISFCSCLKPSWSLVTVLWTTWASWKSGCLVLMYANSIPTIFSTCKTQTQNGKSYSPVYFTP